MKSRIIVTGGAGFIGCNLVEKLNAEGKTDIIVVDTLRTGMKWRNLVGLKYADFIQKKDFLSVSSDPSFTKSVEAIFHLGACSSTTERDADYLMENNYIYTKTLAERSITAGIRFIYASSAATYGLGERGYDDSDEVSPTLHPLNMYGYSKQLFDEYALSQKLASKITGLKFFNVYGPKEAHKESMRSMILKSVEQIQSEGSIKLFKSTTDQFSDGGQKRDFVYVKDCVDIMYWLYKNPKITGIYNVGTGIARTWNDLAKAVFKNVGKPESIEYIDMPASLIGQYQDFTEAKMDKLRAAGYTKPFHSLEEGIADYVQWLRS